MLHDEPGGCYADGGVSEGSGGQSLPLGVNVLNILPAAQHRQRAGGSDLQLRIGEAVGNSAWQLKIRVDYQPTQKLRASPVSGFTQREDLQ
jgi:hypothetical protein